MRLGVNEIGLPAACIIWLRDIRELISGGKKIFLQFGGREIPERKKSNIFVFCGEGVEWTTLYPINVRSSYILLVSH